MADTKITALTDGTTAELTDVIPAARGAGNVKLTLAQIQSLVTGDGPAGSSTELQYRNGGAFGATAGLTWDATNKRLALASATVTTSNPVLDLSQTWNAGAVAFTGLKLNVTDTASAAGSLLLDLQVGGSSKASINKAGGLVVSGSLLSSSGTAILGSAQTIGSVQLYMGATPLFYVAANQIRVPSFGIWFCSGGNTNDPDFSLLYDAANTLAQRNGANAQAFNLYNTYTDASNGEWFEARWASNVLRMGTTKNGTGTQRALVLGAGIRLDVNVDGTNCASFAPSSFNLRSAASIGWVNSASTYGSADVGLARSGAAVLKITNGSTGIGELIFKVPTSDPGITGALWNNAGTLSVSA